MTPNELKQKQITINNEITSYSKNNHEFHDPIFDGVVNEELFLSSKTKPKILWILKEPWEKLEENEKGGGWDLVKDLLKDGWHSNKGSYAIMAYVSYSVFNDFKKYSNISYLTQDSRVGDSLKYIAYINIKKFPGSTSSNKNEISEYFYKYKDILIKQIKIINPDIIIGGNTLPFFYDYLEIENDYFNKEISSAWYFKKNNRLYVHAYHPAQISIPKEKYVDDIVEIIKLYY
ncbi:MAG: hypothetical protein OEZ22_14880 [Spirochaetia bacterium]|nr:hypothetical protein [Spirochaetia bacterium]